MANTKRKGLSKKVRFEVFKRDGFKCQYCGACAPEVVLEVDHVDPVSKGGKNDLMNLVTACKPCNSGKSDTPLSDDSALQKQRAMLDELAARREQLEMMVSWREGLRQISVDAADQIADAWDNQTVGYVTNENGKQNIKKWLRTFSVAQLLEAVDIAADQYLEFDEKGNATRDSVSLGFSKIPGIARLKSMGDDERELYYVRGICRNRFNYCNDVQCLSMLREAFGAGVEIDELKAMAREERNWTGWCSAMNDAIRRARG